MIYRMLFALLNGSAMGVATYLLCSGLLPETKEDLHPPDPGIVATDDGFYMRAPGVDSPALRAEKRKYAMSLGLGALTGVLSCLGIYYLVRFWEKEGKRQRTQPISGRQGGEGKDAAGFQGN